MGRALQRVRVIATPDVRLRGLLAYVLGLVPTCCLWGLDDAQRIRPYLGDGLA